MSLYNNNMIFCLIFSLLILFLVASTIRTYLLEKKGYRRTRVEIVHRKLAYVISSISFVIIISVSVLENYFDFKNSLLRYVGYVAAILILISMRTIYKKGDSKKLW